MVTTTKNMLSDLEHIQIEKIEGLRKMTETMNPQRNEIESIKQIQAVMQEIKNSTESICSRINEDRISDIKDRLVGSNHKKIS